jgi:hypothetical protein
MEPDLTDKPWTDLTDRRMLLGTCIRTECRLRSERQTAAAVSDRLLTEARAVRGWLCHRFQWSLEPHRGPPATSRATGSSMICKAPFDGPRSRGGCLRCGCLVGRSMAGLCFSSGWIRSGRCFESNAIPELRKQAACLAERLYDVWTPKDLSHNSDGPPLDGFGPTRSVA